jgi:hypothetical protein
MKETGSKRNIIVKIKEKEDVGYCNACTERDYNYVFEIELRSLLFRLCYKCKDILCKKLAGSSGIKS